MKPTIKYVTERFEYFNTLCFEGTLPLPPIRISNARRSLGMITYRRERLPDGSWRFHTFQFRISNLIDRSEREIEDTILHEMIHYYILYNQMQDTSPHGDLFKRFMNSINRRFNRNISISHRYTTEEKENDIQRRHHLICLMKFIDNSYGVMVAVRSRIFELWDTPRLIKQAVSYDWFVSPDPFFNRYPRSLKLKVYKIERDEIDLHFKTALRLENTGGAIRPIPRKMLS